MSTKNTKFVESSKAVDMDKTIHFTARSRVSNKTSDNTTNCP